MPRGGPLWRPARAERGAWGELEQALAWSVGGNRSDCCTLWGSTIGWAEKVLPAAPLGGEGTAQVIGHWVLPKP